MGARVPRALVCWCAGWCSNAVAVGCSRLTPPPSCHELSHSCMHALLLWLAAGDLRAANRLGTGSEGGPGGTGRQAAQREERLRRSMQVYVTAWLLSAEVDERRAEGHLAVMAADMRGF